MRTRDRIYSNIVEGLPRDHDEFHLLHKPGSLAVKIKPKEEKRSNLFNL